MLSEQLHIFTQLMRQEKWSEAEAAARSIFNLDELECNLKYVKNIHIFRNARFLKFCIYMKSYRFNLIISRLAEVCLAKGDFDKGLEYINVIMEHEDVTALHIIRAILLSSQIMCASSTPDNRTVISTNCMMHLSFALELTRRNHLSYYNALIKMHLANVQVSFFY